MTWESISNSWWAFCEGGPFRGKRVSNSVRSFLDHSENENEGNKRILNRTMGVLLGPLKFFT